MLTLILLSNQTAAGLALTIFGRGFSSLAGAAFVGIKGPVLPKLTVPGLSQLPFFGPTLFGQDALVYGSFVILAAVAWFLSRTHGGLVLRAVGDSHDAAHAIGYSVNRIRFGATVFGGAMAGLAGGYMSLAYSPMWAENMTAGRGWIALALVVFATWRPFWLVGGAYLFGSIMYLSLYVQGVGRADSLAADFGAALCRHRGRAGDHLARSPTHPPQPAGVPGQVFRRRRLSRAGETPHFWAPRP